MEHFRSVGGATEGARALCVLDRDDGAGWEPSGAGESGLEFFTWSRRHIESYLLVPGAIRRALRLPDDDERVNRNGGAIALGHPLGASGARLVQTATFELEETGGRLALCSMCIGIGQGIATLIERV